VASPTFTALITPDTQDGLCNDYTLFTAGFGEEDDEIEFVQCADEPCEKQMLTHHEAYDLGKDAPLSIDASYAHCVLITPSEQCEASSWKKNGSISTCLCITGDWRWCDPVGEQVV